VNAAPAQPPATGAPAAPPLPAPLPFAATMPAPAAAPAAGASAADAEAVAILAQYRQEPDTGPRQIKWGCVAYTVAAALLVLLSFVAIHVLAHRR